MHRWDGPLREQQGLMLCVHIAFWLHRPEKISHNTWLSCSCKKSLEQKVEALVRLLMTSHSCHTSPVWGSGACGAGVGASR